AGITVVLAPFNTPDTVLQRLISLFNVKALVYKTEASARIAKLFSPSLPVKHWLIVGGSAERSADTDQKKLESVVGSAFIADEKEGEDRELIEDRPLLLVPKEGSSEEFIGFSESLLLSGIERAAEFLSGRQSEKSYLYCGFSNYSFTGALLKLILPPFSLIPSFVTDGSLNQRTFWQQVLAEDVEIAVLSLSDILAITQRGKARGWYKPEHFLVTLVEKKRLSKELLKRFETSFKTPVLPSFFLPEAGGFVSGFKIKEFYQREKSREKSLWDIEEGALPLSGEISSKAGISFKEVELTSKTGVKSIVIDLNKGSFWEVKKGGSISHFEYGAIGFNSNIGGQVIHKEGKDYLRVWGDLNQAVVEGSSVLNLEEVRNIVLTHRGVKD
ncbi:MAG: hypothetical protein D6780_08765, partial [Candidatus Dadabacteria bacterium]